MLHSNLCCFIRFRQTFHLIVSQGRANARGQLTEVREDVWVIAFQLRVCPLVASSRLDARSSRRDDCPVVEAVPSCLAGLRLRPS